MASVRTDQETSVARGEGGWTLLALVRILYLILPMMIHFRRTTNLTYVLLAAVFRVDYRW